MASLSDLKHKLELVRRQTLVNPNCICNARSGYDYPKCDYLWMDNFKTIPEDERECERYWYQYFVLISGDKYPTENSLESKRRRLKEDFKFEYPDEDHDDYESLYVSAYLPENSEEIDTIRTVRLLDGRVESDGKLGGTIVIISKDFEGIKLTDYVQSVQHDLRRTGLVYNIAASSPPLDLNRNLSNATVDGARKQRSKIRTNVSIIRFRVV